MGMGADVRAKLPLCGDCKNCKLQVWATDDTEINKKGSVKTIAKLEQGIYFTVRCNWLKTAVLEPLALQVCEGKQGQED